MHELTLIALKTPVIIILAVRFTHQRQFSSWLILVLLETKLVFRCLSVYGVVKVHTLHILSCVAKTVDKESDLQRRKNNQ